MKRRVVRSKRAVNDLIEIWAYVAIHNPDAADRLLETIDSQFTLLAEHPEIGRERPELGHGVRSFANRGYLIYYRVRHSRVSILRCLHGAGQEPRRL